MKNDEMHIMLNKIENLSAKLARALLAENNFMVQRDENGQRLQTAKDALQRSEDHRKQQNANLAGRQSKLSGMQVDLRALHGSLRRPSEAKARLEILLKDHGVLLDE